MHHLAPTERKIRILIQNGILFSAIIGVIYIARFDVGRALLYFIAIPALLLLPQFFVRLRKKNLNHTFLAEVELLILLGIMLAVLGENFLYDIIPYFDSVVHFLNGSILTVLIVSLNHERWLDKRFSPLKTILFAGLIPAIMNEIYEFSADHLFNTHVWGDWLKPLWIDTGSDILLQTIGSIIATIILERVFHEWVTRWKKTAL